jgi:hypothetical protein
MPFHRVLSSGDNSSGDNSSSASASSRASASASASASSSARERDHQGHRQHHDLLKQLFDLQLRYSLPVNFHHQVTYCDGECRVVPASMLHCTHLSSRDCVGRFHQADPQGFS